jgi:predicted alpha/beta-fold hydrolase
MPMEFLYIIISRGVLSLHCRTMLNSAVSTLECSHVYFQGLIDDSLTVFQWILANTNNRPVYLWGHSLGSAYV